MKRLLLLLLLPTLAIAKTKEVQKGPDIFYVYSDKRAVTNHYIASGWMGDYGDIKLVEGDTTTVHSGSSSIKIVYSAEAKQGANWAGIYWQHPPNNWGTVQGGYNLNQYKKLTFWAKAVSHGKLGVQVSEFKVGGIIGTFSDSAAISIGPVDLTNEWKQYTLDISGNDLSQILGGFCVSWSRDNNPDGFDLYLDDIRFE
jgi:hypothetical protein